jgi:hypothetical protein
MLAGISSLCKKKKNAGIEKKKKEKKTLNRSK